MESLLFSIIQRLIHGQRVVERMQLSVCLVHLDFRLNPFQPVQEYTNRQGGPRNNAVDEDQGRAEEVQTSRQVFLKAVAVHFEQHAEDQGDHERQLARYLEEIRRARSIGLEPRDKCQETQHDEHGDDELKDAALLDEEQKTGR
jgi:hypothetical protein